MHYGEVTGDIVRYDDGWTYPSDGAMGGGVVITLKIASDHIERDLCPIKSPLFLHNYFILAHYFPL